MSNALASEKSPYLLQHADNPVAWLPWGDEAFARARAEQKPIFLSIGYSTCHWCHVMAHESFADATVAEVLNSHFISIKVDREERPDVDAVYMAYVQALTGHGGWPLSVWLTPELKPFYGGTYFPPEDRPGRHGFLTVLQALAEGWVHEREKLVAESERLLGLLRERVPAQVVSGAVDENALTDAAGEAFERCFQQLFESFDPTNGGFGGAPKFPRASSLHFLSRCAAIQGSDTAAGREAAEMAATTLARMAVGGIHDAIGGGYHRYAVDETWFVPHFEKMLYDQAQIAVNALDVFKATGREVYAWMARDIFDYVLRDLAAPGGGFYSAEDADSLVAGGEGAHAEGAFYVWTRAELESVLGAGAAFFCDLYDVRAEGNVPKELDPQGEFAGKNILRQKRPLGEVAAEHGMPAADASDALVGLLERLRAVRAGRPRPHLDDKIITAWNGLMISALARASTCPAESLADKRAFYREAAEAAARFVLRELHDPATGTLYRSFRDGRGSAEGFAEDYACFVAALLDLHEATLDVRWLREAEALQATMDARFWDDAGGGYFNSDAGDASIVVRLKDDYDGAEPAPNSLAATNLMRLHALLGGAGRREKALRTVVALQGVWSKTPHALPELLCALEWTLAEARHVVIVGDPASAAFQALVAVVHERAGALRVVLAADGGSGQAWLAERAPWIAGMTPVDGGAAAYVCERFSCQAPVCSPGELRGRLR